MKEFCKRESIWIWFGFMKLNARKQPYWVWFFEKSLVKIASPYFKTEHSLHLLFETQVKQRDFFRSLLSHTWLKFSVDFLSQFSNDNKWFPINMENNFCEKTCPPSLPPCLPQPLTDERTQQFVWPFMYHKPPHERHIKALTCKLGERMSGQIQSSL